MIGSSLLAIYRGVWKAAMPLVSWCVQRKDAKKLVPVAVTSERFGHSDPPAYWRKSTKLSGCKDNSLIVWIHGASLGECLSGLPLVDLALSHRFGKIVPFSTNKKIRVVMSTATIAARQVITERLKDNESAACILAPLDHPQCVQNFYDAWQPDVGIWIESEIWPTLISEAAQRGIRIGLVNGRMSAQSFRLWQLPGLRKFSKSIVGLFTLVICQDEHNRRRFELLGAQNAFVALNLKLASIRLNSNANKANALRSAIGSRPAWVAASTHTNEEVMMTEVHFELSKRLPKDQHLLTLIIPRHPHRTSVIIKQLYQKFPEISIGLRSRDGLPTNGADVFIVDTMDETSLIYDCISTAVIGGSFIERGGHNPIEPLRAGCYVLTGPHMENFETLIYQLNQWLSISEALRPVANSKELVVALADRLTKLQYSSKDSTPACPSSARTRQMRAMGCLAESTISLYQRHLIKWLAKDAHVMVHSESIKK